MSAISDSGWVRDDYGGISRSICDYEIRVEINRDGCFAFFTFLSVECSDSHKFFPRDESLTFIGEAEKWLLAQIPKNLINPLRCPLLEMVSRTGRKIKKIQLSEENRDEKRERVEKLHTALFTDNTLFASVRDYKMPEKYKCLKAATLRAVLNGLLLRYNGEELDDKFALLKAVELGLLTTRDNHFSLTSDPYFFCEIVEEIRKHKKSDVEWFHYYLISRSNVGSLHLLVIYMALNNYPQSVISEVKRRIVAVETLNSPAAYSTILQKARKTKGRARKKNDDTESIQIS